MLFGLSRFFPENLKSFETKNWHSCITPVKLGAINFQSCWKKIQYLKYITHILHHTPVKLGPINFQSCWKILGGELIKVINSNLLLIVYLKCSIWNTVFEIQFLKHSIWNRVFEIQYLKSSILNPVFKIQYLKSSIWNPVNEIENLKFSI